MNRFILAIAALSLLVLPAAPSIADDGPLRLDACQTTKPVLTLDGDSYTAAMPLLAGDDVVSYTLDLSGQDVAADEDMDDKANVSASATWDVIVNDYDLGLNGNVTEGFQPIDPAEEFISTSATHCSTVTVSVVNFNATGGDSVNVSVFVSL